MKKLFILLTLSSLSATVIHVPEDHPTIQAGINASVDGDTVLVQPGTYYENINFNGHNITVGSLLIMTGNTDYISQTVIDGNQNGSVVTFENGEDEMAVFTGFKVINGFGTIQYSTYYGGGITVINDSNPILTNLIITNNNALKGGGVKIHNSSPQIIDTIISNNNAEGDSFSHGGGIHSKNSNLILTRVDIIGNSAGYNSGGFYNRYGRPILTDVRIMENYAANDGGGVGCGLSEAILQNCIISNNVSSHFGGGVVFWEHANLVLNQVLIAQNTADQGGGFFSHLSSPRLINVTISDNISMNSIDLEIQYSPDLTLYNSIIWDSVPFEILPYLNINYCNIMGYYQVGNNFSEDPLFINPSEMDYSLQIDSPCIDAGDPDSPPDPDGTVADLGAFYFDQFDCNNYEFICGDLNGDEMADILDIVMAVSIIIGQIYPTQTQLCSFDFNADGVNDILDIIIGINNGCWWQGY